MSLHYESAREVVSLLLAEGFDAVFAGGWVRDHLLGIESDDIDIATSASPDELTEHFIMSCTEGTVHGVCTVEVNGYQLELATYRIDGEYSDGRRPESVHFTKDRKLDAFRRDFTVNGMFYQPLDDEVFDYVGGLDDLENRKIRFIGEPGKRIDEDRLRILRALRFAVKLQFELEEETLDAIRKCSSSIRDLTGQRIQAELFKTLGYGRAGFFLRLLSSASSLGVLFPGLKQEDSESLVQKLNQLDSADPLSNMALIIQFMPEAEKENLLHLLKLSREQYKTIRDLSRDSDLLTSGSVGLAQVKLWMMRPEFSRILSLSGVMAEGASVLNRLEEIKQIYLDIQKDPSSLRPWITGTHLKEAGLMPGPHFREILEQWHNRQLEGEFSGREEALGLFQRWVEHGKPGY